MKYPKTVKIYCPYCKRHTLHTIKIVKKKTRRKMAHGQRIFLRKMKGYGSFPRSKPNYEKPTKRVDLRFKCTVCGKSHTHGKGWRAKKLEFKK